jgi:TonB family protein
VSVRLTDTANVVIAQTVSDTLGEFLLTLERPGKYRLYFLSGAVELGASDPIEVSADDFHQRIYVLSAPRDSTVYFEFQVAKPVAVRPGNPGPRYPEELRARSIEGEVLMQFVVDTTGRVILGTLRVLRSTDPGFTREVERVLWRMRFLPAELKDGRRVKQLVQMPFQFTLTY